MAPQAHPLHQDGYVHCRGLYAVPLGNPGLPSEPQDFSELLLFPSMPSGRGHHTRVVYGLKSAPFSVFCPLSPCFAQLSEIPQLPLGPPVRELPSVQELFLLLDSLPLGTSSSPEVLHLSPFCVSIPLSYLIAASLACPHGDLASSAVVWRLLCRKCSLS